MSALQSETGKLLDFSTNGAGKSTIMNIITGYLSATSGNVTVGGFDILEFATEAKKALDIFRRFRLFILI